MKIKQHLKRLSPTHVFIEFVSLVFAVLQALAMNSHNQFINLENDVVMVIE